LGGQGKTSLSLGCQWENPKSEKRVGDFFCYKVHYKLRLPPTDFEYFLPRSEIVVVISSLREIKGNQ
jgi:hypothetical protein